MVAELQYRHRVLSVTPLDQHSCIVIGISHLRYVTLLCALHIYDKLIGQNTKILLLVGYLPLLPGNYQNIQQVGHILAFFPNFNISSVLLFLHCIISHVLISSFTLAFQIHRYIMSFCVIWDNNILLLSCPTSVYSFMLLDCFLFVS